jgi:hypothetical protein
MPNINISCFVFGRARRKDATIASRRAIIFDYVHAALQGRMHNKRISIAMNPILCVDLGGQKGIPNIPPVAQCFGGGRRNTTIRLRA